MKTTKPVFKEIKISKIQTDEYRQNDNPENQEEVNKLAESYQEFGFFHPITVQKIDGQEEEIYQIIAGRNRLHAAKQLGLEKITARITYFTGEEQRIKAMIDENGCRSSMKPSEMVEIFNEAKRVIKDRDLNRGERVEAPRITAQKAAGKSRETIRRANKVFEAAKENPELKPIADEMDKTGNIHKAYNKIFKKPDQKKEVTLVVGDGDGSEPIKIDTSIGDAPVDSYGKEVPKNLRDTFSNDFFELVKSHLRRARTQVEAQINNLPWITQVQTIVKTLEQLEQIIDNGRPFSVCVYCQGSKKKDDKVCHPCKGSGYFSFSESQKLTNNDGINLAEWK